MRPPKEQTLEEYFKEQVHLVGGETRKVQWTGRRGAPDRLAMFLRHGRHAYVELKEAQQGWGLQDHQEREHKKMKKAGMDVWVIQTKPEVWAFIQEMTR